ncbi:DegT/DnrJ/EryC1/StrS family aminotransferase [Candidatus Thioglobus sp.]|nr:DegT/DnrJ/EryC1/StrS family aminotransferase [Candidatus Thioglobus sp.]
MDINFHKTHITQDEIDAVVLALKSGWTTMGPKTIEFERKFSEHILKNNSSSITFNTQFLHAISLNSATAALHLALKAINLKENDEVIVPTNTFVATAEVVTYFKAIPVLCDIEYETHNIDVTQIEKLITSKTRAIIPVHYGGQPCDMDEIFEIANKHELNVIEDAAHALPSYYKGTIIGGLKSDATCFSFYATKTLSTGEGGMLVTNNSQYADKVRINRLHGISKDPWKRFSQSGGWYYEVVDNGHKYNMTDINAAIGVVQLKKLEEMFKKRKEISDKYDLAFESVKGVEPLQIKRDRKTSYHLYVIKVKNRDSLISKLNEFGIGVSVHYIPIHMHPYYKETYGYKQEDYPVANQVYYKSISLPIYPDLSDDEVKFIVENVIKYAE